MRRRPRAIFFALLSATALVRGETLVSFRNDVMPLLGKMGCSTGNCHAKPEGQNNFKLSIFGYDPRGDYAEIVEDDRGRRVFPANPEESLFLKKATGAVPHEGGPRFDKGSAPYRTLLAWMQQGMKFEIQGEPVLKSIAVTPHDQAFKKGATQQLQVIASYSDGSKRDVTALADYLSQDKEAAAVDEHGLVTVGSLTGEGVIVVRYMGIVDTARITVPAEKVLPDSVYAALPVNNEIDRLVYARLKKLGILPSATCSDAEFLRRASLDAIGRLPIPAFAREFVSTSKVSNKREALIEMLLQHPNYADHWAIKWGDLVRPNPSRVGVKPVLLMDRWLRESFRANKPYNQMVGELLTATGSTHEYGPVAMWRDKREPVDAASFLSQVFLGVRMDCAKCHHHPTEKWSQEDYYQFAAFFAQMKRKGQGISAPISGEPEYFWYGGNKGTLTHPVTDVVMVPKPPDGREMPYVDGLDPRMALADWMTASDNPFFARAIVNRIWAEFFGRGIVDPVDDLRASNPATNDPLLNWLAQDFVTHGFDLKHLMRTIMSSRVYQISSAPNETNVADTRNFSRAYKRRLSAEVLHDAVTDVSLGEDNFNGLPAGARAVETWNHKIESDFLDAFGRPNASQECPCERDRKSSVVQALHLMNAESLQEKISRDKGRAHRLAAAELSPPQIVRSLYFASLCRGPGETELRTALAHFAKPGIDRVSATEDVLWSLLNSAEFVFNH